MGTLLNFLFDVGLLFLLWGSISGITSPGNAQSKKFLMVGLMLLVSSIGLGLLLPSTSTSKIEPLSAAAIFSYFAIPLGISTVLAFFIYLARVVQIKKRAKE